MLSSARNRLSKQILQGPKGSQIMALSLESVQSITPLTLPVFKFALDCDRRGALLIKVLASSTRGYG